MEHIIKTILVLLKEIYSKIFYRSSIIIEISKNIKEDNSYFNIIQEELELYYFNKITGIYTRDNKECKKYVNAYYQHKEKINLPFKEFVSTKEYITIDNELNISVDLKKSNHLLYYIGNFMLIFSIILFLLFLLSIVFIVYDNTFVIKSSIGVTSIITMFLGIYFKEPYENANKLKSNLENTTANEK